MAEINRELDRYLVECVPQMAPTEVYYEDKSNRDTVKQMMYLERYDPYFAELLQSGEVYALAELALGEKAVPKKHGILQQAPRHRQADAPAPGRLLLQGRTAAGP